MRQIIELESRLTAIEYVHIAVMFLFGFVISITTNEAALDMCLALVIVLIALLSIDWAIAAMQDMYKKIVDTEDTRAAIARVVFLYRLNRYHLFIVRLCRLLFAVNFGILYEQCIRIVIRII